LDGSANDLATVNYFAKNTGARISKNMGFTEWGLIFFASKEQ
jgi:hypothetical protein